MYVEPIIEKQFVSVSYGVVLHTAHVSKNNTFCIIMSLFIIITSFKRDVAAIFP